MEGKKGKGEMKEKEKKRSGGVPSSERGEVSLC
jgi:hypothetical protein